MAKKKYICTGCNKCTEPCTVELSGDADMTKDPTKLMHCGTWVEVPAEEDTNKEQRPKLTEAVFSLDDCPEWAQYAAVDANGLAYWYEDKPEQLTTEWQSNERARQIGQDYDASDWKNSLIEIHVEERLPKLTVDVFSMDACPLWARYAAVDENGRAYWYDEKPMLVAQAWAGTGTHFARPIEHDNIVLSYDASDWKNSLIERRRKLTAEIFNHPECPADAVVAVVNDDGTAAWGTCADIEPIDGGFRTKKPWDCHWTPIPGGACFDASDWKNSVVRRLRKLTEEIFDHPKCPADAVVAVVNASGTAAWGNCADIVCDGSCAFHTDHGNETWTYIPGGACFDATDWQHSAVYRTNVQPKSTEPAPLKLTYDVFSYSNPNGWTYVIRSQVEHGKTYARCPEWARYAAVDQSGAVCVYDTKPVLRSTDWYPDSGGRCAVVCNTEKLALRFDITGWKNSLIERPAAAPKLTTDVFSMKACPEWARYAAVDANGFGYWYAEKPEFMCNRRGWIGASERNIAVPIIREGTRVLYDSSDWEHSLIERPTAVPRLTADVFSMEECPKWARFTAVDADGIAYWYEVPPRLCTSTHRWESNGLHAKRLCHPGSSMSILFDADGWKNSLIERQPAEPRQKLTTEVFSMPECPEWARYAAVDASGMAYWYDGVPRWSPNGICWQSTGTRAMKICHVGEGAIPLFDATDWQHSSIERPAVVPDWFKPGVLAYNNNTHTCFHVTASTEYRENYLEAKVRPFSDDELERFCSFVHGPFNSKLVVTGFRPKGITSGKPEICVLGNKWLTAEELLTYGSRPQGIKQYHSREGAWIDCGLSS